MKAVVYAVETNKGWQALFSIAWEADAAYWSGKARSLWRLREELPLGFAEAVCARLAAALREGRPQEWTKEMVFRELLRTVERVWAAGDEKRGWRRESVGDGREQLRKGWSARLKASREGMSVGCKGLWVVEAAALGVGGAGMGAADAEALERWARLAGERLQGRSLLREEAAAVLAADEPELQRAPAMLRALQLAALRGAVRLAAALEPAAAAPHARGARRRQGLRCRRCGSGEARMRRTACASCGRSGCAVCEACATLGRSRECGLLVLGASHREQPKAQAPRVSLDRWGLSPAQRDASAAAVRFLRGEAGGPAARLPILARAARLFGNLPYRAPLARFFSQRPAFDRSFLLWAVTGAGKTEMIFPLLDTVLSGGGRALVATPRKDVVLELAPRLAKAFPGYSRAVLYGGSEDRWENAALTLATTHQLLRFQEAFDLVLIDELDAFPYHNDPMLHYAAAKSRNRQGTTVLLSATPPAFMQRAARRGALPCAKVPVRYHRHPLPVPRRIQVAPLHRWIGKGKLPQALNRQLSLSVERGAQLFVFVPYIKHVRPMVELLRGYANRFRIPPQAIDGTSSVDPERADKVVAFRKAAIRILVTTTILERGVTIPRSDVFILDAQQPLFDEAALVQMAGRAGRSADDPAGGVYFCSSHLTRSQQGAGAQIRGMNRIARRRGYLVRKEDA